MDQQQLLELLGRMAEDATGLVRRIEQMRKTAPTTNPDGAIMTAARKAADDLTKVAADAAMLQLGINAAVPPTGEGQP